MPNWHQINEEIRTIGSTYDMLRRKYIKNFQKITGRNVICYYSSFLNSPSSIPSQYTAIHDSDKNGFMTVINGLDTSNGLDLVLHTPGGNTAATESIVEYLKKMFGNDIRCFVPQIAMSAGTMIACSCKEIYMGKQSSLGPIDPQFGGLSAHGILEEFQRAHKDITENPNTVPLWQPIISKYTPTLIGECEKSITWSNELIKTWLADNMLKDDPHKVDTIDTILKELGDHAISLSHARHLSFDKCAAMGLKVTEIESDDELQDALLSLHHIFIHTFQSTDATKIIENHDGIAFIIQVHLGMNRGSQKSDHELQKKKKNK